MLLNCLSFKSDASMPQFIQDVGCANACGNDSRTKQDEVIEASAATHQLMMWLRP
jgi:hypothetical protein